MNISLAVNPEGQPVVFNLFRDSEHHESAIYLGTFISARAAGASAKIYDHPNAGEWQHGGSDDIVRHDDLGWYSIEAHAVQGV